MRFLTSSFFVGVFCNTPFSLLRRGKDGRAIYKRGRLIYTTHMGITGRAGHGPLRPDTSEIHARSRTREEACGMKIGFVGLGIMGRPMALNLLRSGCELYVNDLSEAAVKALCDPGGDRGKLRGGVHHFAQREHRASGAAGGGRDTGPYGPRHAGGGHELHHPGGSEGLPPLCAGAGRSFPGRAGQRRGAQGHRRHAGLHDRRHASGL